MTGGGGSGGGSGSSGGASGSGAASAVQEYTVRVPRAVNKHHCIMQFNSSLLVDFAKWSQVKMVREVPHKDTVEDETPKFGAGSEFGKDAREEARRKRFGFVARSRRAEQYPWLVKVGGGGALGRRYRGVRGGGITENAAYYVFTQAKDGVFDAFPVTEWYNFQHVQRHKVLSAEEAEEQFSKRDKIMNYFSVMMKKRLKKDEDTEADGELVDDKKTTASKKNEFKISDMDEWPSSDDDNSSANETNADQDAKSKKKNALKDKMKRKRRKSNIKDEAFEDSDDGDEEGREMDYDSESSESEQEVKLEKEEKGVDQEDALKRLLDSDAEVDESSEEEKDKNGEQEDKETSAAAAAAAADEDSQSPVKKKSKSRKAARKDDDSSDNSDSADSATVDRSDAAKSSANNGQTRDETAGRSAHGGASAPPSLKKPPPPTKTERIVQDMKRRTTDGATVLPPGKRAKLDSSIANSQQLSNDTGITEDAVRKYLTRKPMTTIELLQKFKSKKVGLSSDQLVPMIALILKRINPTKHTVKGKMYLSIKK